MQCDFSWTKECGKISEEEHKKGKKDNWYYPKYYAVCQNCEVRKKGCSCKYVSEECRSCQESANSRY
jgi:hypothetical protein